MERTYWIYVTGSRNDARVEEDCEELNDGVEPEEHHDFLATNSSVFAANMVYHDTGHNDCHNVYKACCYSSVERSIRRARKVGIQC